MSDAEFIFVFFLGIGAAIVLWTGAGLVADFLWCITNFFRGGK